MPRDPVISRLDATLLIPGADEAQVRQLCRDAVSYQAAAICVYPRWLPVVTEYPITACVVISFPHGSDSAESKAQQAEQVISAGAEEIDMVIDLSAALASQYQTVADDVAHVVEACRGRAVKAIIETGIYDDAAVMLDVARAAEAGGATFVKTSTGFGPRGASLEDIIALRTVLSPTTRLKASGGIRQRDFAEQLISASADRIGASTISSLLPAGGETLNSSD